MRYPFESAEAMQLNRDIFETMYFGALTASNELAARDGPYSTYAGSPASKGLLQPDLWGIALSDERWDWTALRARIAQHGLRNSLLLAPMPTASTAQILGNNESTEPFTSNMYNRRVLAGEFTVVNKYLLKELVEKGLWTAEVRNQIIADRGNKEPLQDRVGDKAEGDHRPGGGPRSLHLPVPILEHPHGRAHHCEAHLNALLRLEEGPQDRHVLPAFAA
jgi:ribonucleotide reductase alpha subunit